VSKKPYCLECGCINHRYGPPFKWPPQEPTPEIDVSAIKLMIEKDTQATGQKDSVYTALSGGNVADNCTHPIEQCGPECEIPNSSIQIPNLGTGQKDELIPFPNGEINVTGELALKLTIKQLREELAQARQIIGEMRREGNDRLDRIIELERDLEATNKWYERYRTALEKAEYIIVEDNCDECGTFRAVKYHVKPVSEALGKDGGGNE
jgi:hypothetical protein